MTEIQSNSLVTVAATAAPDKKILFGKYELGRLLGRGGFAKVYHARHTRTGQSVAVKAISKAHLEKNQLEFRIKREVTIMSHLRHPHIVRLFEVLATKTKVYLIMEFAKGGELFTKVAKGRFSEDLARRYFQQLISAVGYCHSRGIYHRDLKPENLLLDEAWNLKISDFGLSTVVKDRAQPGPVLHTLCGTPAYVAPELIAKKGYFGDKTDVWSCGIILYVMTAGFLPFNDTNLMNLYKKIYRGEFRCPRWMSHDLRGLLHRLLDVNPNTRITLDEILHDPWFKNGYQEVNVGFYHDYDYLKLEEGGGGGGGDGGTLNDDEGGVRCLNAFDLISFSPGFSLSGLLVKNKGWESTCETFLSTEEAEKVVEAVEKAARECHAPRVVMERVKGGAGVRLEGQDGNFGLVVMVHWLIEELVVVEVRKREKDVGPSHEFWRSKLRPKICHLIHQPGQVDQTGSLPGPSN